MCKKTGISMDNAIVLIEYTDPYCTWCWGSEPILKRIQEVYGDQVSINYKMGGLVEDIRDFYDPLNNIGGETWYIQVADHWLEASRRHGMPVDVSIWYDIKDDFRSTYPASIAYKAAEFQDLFLSKIFLRRMREAAAAERLPIHRFEIQLRLAGEVGLNLERLAQDIKSGEAERAFLEDLSEARNKGITGFPTFLLRNENGEEVILHGYQKFKTFEKMIEELSPSLDKNRIVVNEKTIIDFVKKIWKSSYYGSRRSIWYHTKRCKRVIRYIKKKETLNRIASGK